MDLKSQIHENLSTRVPAGEQVFGYTGPQTDEMVRFIAVYKYPETGVCVFQVRGKKGQTESIFVPPEAVMRLVKALSPAVTV